MTRNVIFYPNIWSPICWLTRPRLENKFAWTDGSITIKNRKVLLHQRITDSQGSGRHAQGTTTGFLIQIAQTIQGAVLFFGRIALQIGSASIRPVHANNTSIGAKYHITE